MDLRQTMAGFILAPSMYQEPEQLALRETEAENVLKLQINAASVQC